jgi:hypothetical protein
LHTCTYSPQKRCDLSAFALTYIFLLSSCNVFDVFIIVVLPHNFVRKLSLVRSLRSVPIRELLRYYSPIRLPLTFGSFPCIQVIEPTLLRPFLSGMRRVSPVALHILVTMLLLPPRQPCHFPFQSVSERHTAFAIRLLARPAGFNHFRGYLCIHLRCGLVTCVSCFTGHLSMSFMSFISSSHVI